MPARRWPPRGRPRPSATSDLSQLRLGGRERRLVSRRGGSGLRSAHLPRASRPPQGGLLRAQQPEQQAGRRRPPRLHDVDDECGRQDDHRGESPEHRLGGSGGRAEARRRNPLLFAGADRRAQRKGGIRSRPLDGLVARGQPPSPARRARSPCSIASSEPQKFRSKSAGTNSGSRRAFSMRSSPTRRP